VAGIVGISASDASRTLAHELSFGITGAVFLALCLYTGCTARKRRWGTHCQIFGPTYLMIFACLLIMADLTRHVLQDWGAIGMRMYRPGCAQTDDQETMACLSVVGWFFTIIMTYLGFALLFVATLWNANICEICRKFRAKWRELRQEDVQQTTANGTAAAGADHA